MTYAAQTHPIPATRVTLLAYRLTGIVVAMAREALARQAMKASLGKLSEKHLRDIGLTRNDLSVTAHVNLPSSGALELVKAARSRSGNW